MKNVKIFDRRKGSCVKKKKKKERKDCKLEGEVKWGSVKNDLLPWLYRIHKGKYKKASL